MRTLTSILLVFALIGISVNRADAKNYTSKAERPSASDHTWWGYDYNFNLDENRQLTGSNTFSKVYNTAPTKWHNTGYYGEGISMFTGSETLTITVLPGDFNYTYTINTEVTEWLWDTHQLKWVKRRDLPTNGIRTFTIKDGMLYGPFEFPIAASPFGVHYLKGNAVDGVIPNGDALSWKIFDYSTNVPVTDTRIKSVGDTVRINVETYMADVLKEELTGQYGSDENGTWVKLRFPVVGDNHDLLAMIGSRAGVGSALEPYALITLPDVFYDAYVDPYVPVTSILPNGHTLITTKQHNQQVHTLETWEENGFSYSKEYDGSEQPAIGIKNEDGKKFIHLIDKDCEEKGFFNNGSYFLTYLTKNEGLSRRKYEIDWTPFEAEGYYIISDSEGKKYAVIEEDSNRPSLCNLVIPSSYTKQDTEHRIFKEETADGNRTYSIGYTAALSEQAKEFLKFISHPYIKDKYGPTYGITQITMDSSGNVIFVRPEKEVWETPEQYKSKLDRHNWLARMLSMSKKPDNPLIETANLIGMELNIPDYDTEKIDAKVVGKRTSRLLKKLESLLSEKVNQRAETKIGLDGKPYQDLWPNSVKRAFLKDNRWADFKKVWVSRIVKDGTKVTVYVTTVTDEGRETVTEMTLQDNVPIDEYSTVWIHTAKFTK